MILSFCTERGPINKVQLDNKSDGINIEFTFDSLNRNYDSITLDKLKSLGSVTGKFFEKKGVIPNPESAAKIAYIYLSQIYGKETITEEFPFIISVTGQYWIITGTLHSQKGGVAHIILKKDNGQVIDIFHEK